MSLLDHLEKLVGFKAVAEAGNFRVASDVLHVSQPALSRSIKVLEESLKVSLLERSRRGTKLSREGRTLLDFTRKLLNNTADLEQKLRFPESGLSGKLFVGTFESLSIYLWPKLLKRLSSTLPELSLYLSTNNCEFHWVKLISGELDLIVNAEPISRRGVISEPLYKDKFVFCASRSALKRWNLKQDMKSLTKARRKVPLIHVPSAFDSQGLTIQQHLKKKGYEFEHSYDLDSFETVKVFAKEGLGLAVIPRRVAESEISSGTLIQFQPRGFESGQFGEHLICASMMRENSKEPRVRAVIKAMKAFFSNEN